MGNNDLIKLYQTKEDQLNEINYIFSNYAKEKRIRLIKNYRYTISRTLFWWRSGIVRFIQLKATEDGFELWIAAYKLIFPFLNFWTLYLDVPSDYSRKIRDLKYPFIKEEVCRLLVGAKDEADQINKKMVRDNKTSRTVYSNLLILENAVTVILFTIILAVIFYWLFKFLFSR